MSSLSRSGNAFIRYCIARSPPWLAVVPCLRRFGVPITTMADADAANKLTRDAVHEICQGGLPAGPLTVEPLTAPAGALSAEEATNAKALRAAIEGKLESMPEAERAEAVAHLDDFTLARFWIARDGKLNEAEKMFMDTMAFRAAKNINVLRAELHPAAEHPAGTYSALRHAAVRNHFHAGWGGVARDGSPFFVEHMGRLDVATIDKEPELFELMLDAYAASYLENAFGSVRLASARSGKMQRATTIVDASGASLAMLSHLRVIKSVAKIGTSYYPEIMKRVLIVNAPWIASMAWKALSPFLPEQTRKKVSIYSKKFTQQLLEEIEPSQLPESLGGERTEPNGVPKTEKVPPTLADELRAAATPSPTAADEPVGLS